jgi:hypothetical protein
VRVQVQYRNRVSFPLSLKAYIITQQEKDSLQDWVPDDYLETDFPQASSSSGRQRRCQLGQLGSAHLGAGAAASLRVLPAATTALPQAKPAAAQRRPTAPGLRRCAPLCPLAQRKPVTELKGTTCITHHFEANLGGVGGQQLCRKVAHPSL